MNILQYSFMQRAFITGILLAIITPMIGITIVLKRMSMIGDALSHASLAGVAAGLILGINPVAGAAVVCIIAALSIETIRRKIPRYSEMTLAIIMSSGIGLAGILSGFVKSSANFNSFLFGSIVAISTPELILVCFISVIVFFTLCFFYQELLAIGFDEDSARIAGISVKKIDFLFTILTALAISIASRTAGTLIISSMLVVPVAFGMQVGKSYLTTIIWAISLALFTTILGFFLSYYVGVKPGGAIVLLEVLCFLLTLAVKKIKSH